MWWRRRWLRSSEQAWYCWDLNCTLALPLVGCYKQKPVCNGQQNQSSKPVSFPTAGQCRNEHVHVPQLCIGSFAPVPSICSHVPFPSVPKLQHAEEGLYGCVWWASLLPMDQSIGLGKPQPPPGFSLAFCIRMALLLLTQSASLYSDLFTSHLQSLYLRPVRVEVTALLTSYGGTTHHPCHTAFAQGKFFCCFSSRLLWPKYSTKIHWPPQFQWKKSGGNYKGSKFIGIWLDEWVNFLRYVT